MQDNRLHPVKAILRLFFHILYHQLAFAYDLVAWVVSFGHWRDWVMEVVPFITGTRTLEIGHGPGHLHRFLLSRGLVAVAMDESAPMGRLARRRLISTGWENNSKTATPTQPTHQTAYAQINLTRGMAQHLPFRDGSFDTVIATFPAEYITDPRTLTEVRRCLDNGGRFVVLPVAMPKNRVLSWLFKVTGQTPSEAVNVIREKLMEPFIQSGFDAEARVLDVQSGTLIIIVASKSLGHG
jgi:ubiquinone/menaquinone biosynthesis C-methylase UbiE